ncbi:efflux RND transporter periplasmic adaptor subunit [Nitrospira sp. Kam-Ns4a]
MAQGIAHRVEDSLKIVRSLETRGWWIRLRKWVVTGLLLLVIYYGATSIAAYLSAPRIEMTMSPIAGPVAVTVVPAQKGDIKATVTYTGTVRPWFEVTVSPRTTGWLEQILVDVGDRVKQGQVLVRLDTRELRTQLAERRAHLVFLEQEFQRDTRLVREKAIPQSEADRTKMLFDEAKAQVENIETLLSYTEITSPIDGVVTERLLLDRPGQLVNPGTPVLKLADVSRMRIQVKVAEKDAPHLKGGPPGEGTEAVVRFPALGDKTLPATVSEVFPPLDPTTRTTTAELVVNNSDRAIRAGMYAVVDLVLEKKSDAILIPRQAVLQVDGQAAVFVTDSVVAMKRPATLGLAAKDLVEVLDGVKEGELVIIKGNRGLTDFQEVRVVAGL